MADTRDKKQCLFINEAGNQCRNLTRVRKKFYGDKTLYGKEIIMNVHVCKEHEEEI